MKTKNINRRQKPDIIWWKYDLSDDIIQGWSEWGKNLSENRQMLHFIFKIVYFSKKLRWQEKVKRMLDEYIQSQIVTRTEHEPV